MKYNQKLMNEMADDFEAYLRTVDRYLVIEQVSEKDYNKAVKRIKKCIKHLRKGRGDKVFNEDKYRDFISGRLGESEKNWGDY